MYGSQRRVWPEPADPLDGRIYARVYKLTQRYKTIYASDGTSVLRVTKLAESLVY